MKVVNYMNLNQHPIHLQFFRNRSQQFSEIYHAHQGFEILIVHEGSGNVIVEQQIYELEAGKLFFFRPYQLHRIKINNSNDVPYIRSFFVFEPDLLDRTLSVLPELRQAFHILTSEPFIVQQLITKHIEPLQALLQSAQQRFEQQEQKNVAEEQLIFLLNLLQVLKPVIHAQLSPKSTVRPAKQQLISEQIMSWIEQHFSEPFVLEQLAHDIHLSPNYVSYVFKKQVGSSITEYLTARRIRQACWLIKQGEKSIEEIAHCVGISNFSYFCQLFKRHVGLSPLQFKKEIN